MEDIYIGLGNATEFEDNLVPYHKVASLCHSCINRYFACLFTVVAVHDYSAFYII